MSGNKHIYNWLEGTVSGEKGRHVIPYYLVFTSASLLLAIVGTETHDRHYSYKFSEEFLEAFGSRTAINAHTKWTSRKKVREWLNSFVRNENLSPTNSNLHNVATHEGNGILDTIAAKEPSGVQEPSGAQPLEPNPSQQELFKVGNIVELLCQDCDKRGCWYRCEILEIHERFWKVQYNERKHEEGSGNFKDYIPSPRLAQDYWLSRRPSARLTIRPCPVAEPPTFTFGAAIDAWWRDGWWEGFVITAVSLSSADEYNVFLPGPNKFLILDRTNLRLAREWVGGAWVPVEPQSDIMSYFTSYFKR